MSKKPVSRLLATRAQAPAAIAPAPQAPAAIAPEATETETVSDPVQSAAIAPAPADTEMTPDPIAPAAIAPAPVDDLDQQIAKAQALLTDLRRAKSLSKSGARVRDIVSTPKDLATLGMGGKKLILLNMMLDQNGVNDKEGSAALGWAACAATLVKIQQEAVRQGRKVDRKRGPDGKMRYYVLPLDTDLTGLATPVEAPAAPATA